ncbi:hypothetical protein KC19_12G088200 [Ceratodon purpureus]|uniref:Uncharacterized protein n=1 Tax=Ceratodon purpureus TaxID=3225 RepID=A0A8T0G6B7_CERPU|nr:hypothetical protein KC19_12G088200 [Ceratodon purpureus]
MCWFSSTIAVSITMSSSGCAKTFLALLCYEEVVDMGFFFGGLRRIGSFSSNFCTVNFITFE